MYSGFYSTFIAHIVSLTVTLGSMHYVVHRCYTSEAAKHLMCISLFLPTLNSLVALFRYGMSNGYKLRTLHIITVNFAMIGSYSFVHATVLYLTKSPKSYYITTALNIIPFTENVKKLDYRTRNKRSDAIIAMNCLLLILTAINFENYNAIAFALSFAFGYLYVGDCGYFLDTEVPSIDIYQYMQCFLCYFAVNAFCD